MQKYEYLAHHGVQGMHWYVRRFQPYYDKLKTGVGKFVGKKSKNSSGSASSGKPSGKQSDTKIRNGDVTVKEAYETVKKYVQNQSAKRSATKEIKAVAKAAKEANKAAKQEANRKSKEQKKTEKQDSQKNVKKISDEELQRRINRMKMEKEYRSLKTSELSEGTKIVQNILKKSAENIGTQLGAYALGTLVNKLFKEEVVNPKKGQKDK